MAVPLVATQQFPSAWLSRSGARHEPTQRITPRVGVGKHVGVVGRGLEAPSEKIGGLIDPTMVEFLDSDRVPLHLLVLPAAGLDQTTRSGGARLVRRNLIRPCFGWW